jgi:Zn-dependent protease
MDRSFKLLAVRGIDIRIHITFPLIVVWAAFQYGQAGGLQGALFGVVTMLLLFVLVTLHELGHSFAALHYGIPVRQIVLLPIGGLAQLEKMPEKPVQELVVAIAGPAVNVVLALIAGLLAFSLGVPLVNPFTELTLTFTTLLSYLLLYNVVLLVFNMLPAFPMDGGRVLRALLAMVMDYERATAVAVNIGRIAAVLLAMYAIYIGAFLTLLVSLFILVLGTQELAMVKWRGQMQRSGLGYTVQQAYSAQAGVLEPYASVRQALMQQMQGEQSDFPVAEHGRYIGFVTEDGLLRAANLYGPDTMIYAAMSPDVRPVSPQTDLVDVQQQMARLRVRALPVVEYGRLLGIITYRQIQEFIRSASNRPNNNDTPRPIGV